MYLFYCCNRLRIYQDSDVYNFCSWNKWVFFHKDCLEQVHLMHFAFFTHFSSHKHYNTSSINTCMFAFLDIVYTKFNNHESRKVGLTSVLYTVQDKGNGRRPRSFWTIGKSFSRAIGKVHQVERWHLSNDGDVENIDPRKTKCWNSQPIRRNYTIKR